jgi:peptidoglycan/xylan/chitin deacetylase (PgdA/CDA1 family)
MSIAAEMGFTSIGYDQLHAWKTEGAELPAKPILFDFDHPVRSILDGCAPIMKEFGFTGNLFVNTGFMETDETKIQPSWGKNLDRLSWDELRTLHRDMGWHIGAHTVSHPNLSALVAEDPDGVTLLKELSECDAKLEAELGFTPRDFAFTGTSWSSVAEAKVAERYRFGRLWIVKAEYQADGETIRFAELAGCPELPDEADGGPPMLARYITEESHPLRLPAMEFQSPLMNTPEAFRRYLEGAGV